MEDNILVIENFGSISKVEINTSKSSVLMGPNGSGKSFTALVLHSILNSLENVETNQLYNLGVECFNLLNNNEPDLTRKYKEIFTKYMEIKPNFSSKPIKIPKKDFNQLLLKGIGFKFGEIFEEKLIEVFDVESVDELIKYDENTFKISYNGISVYKSRNMPLYVEKFFDKVFLEKNNISNYEKGKLIKSEFAIEERSDFYYIYLDYDFIKNNGKYDDDVIFSLIYTFISKTIFQHLMSKNSFYIPSARDELVKNKNKFISRNIRDNIPLSSAQTNMAYNLFKLKSNTKEGDFYEIARGIEKEIIGGEINIFENEINTDIYFVDKENNLNLPLKLVSSGVRELSPLILYFKHILKKGDTLIIEEPEAHLHPNQQRKLVKYFVEAINLGLNLLITTHSDFIVAQFNNHIRLNNITLKNFKNNFKEYNDIDRLNFEKINIYSFIFNEKYSSISNKILINHTGFDGFAFIDVTEELCDETMKIVDLE